MSIIDIPLTDVPFDQLGRHIEDLKEYLRRADDPNEAGSNGQTCVSIAVQFCNTDDGIQILWSLLDRGGDPNRPNPIANFVGYTASATSLKPLEYMIDAGLELNEVYDPIPDLLGDGDCPFTLLDYVLSVQAYLNKNRKSLDHLANKYAGGLGPRRRFVDDTIALLIRHGAKRAEELL